MPTLTEYINFFTWKEWTLLLLTIGITVLARDGYRLWRRKS